MDQLVSLTSEEFQQLCSMIGMDKKPFHVMRLKKALEKLSKTNDKPLEITASTSNPPISQRTEPSGSTPSHIIKTTPTKGPPPLLKSAPEELDHQLLPGPSVQPFLPSFLHSDTESSDFSPLVDQQTPVQLTLDPCFCTPGAWDPKRKIIIRKSSVVFPKDGTKQPLSLYKEHVNEAAYQLCLRDPTLLVRRDELLLLSKRAVDPGCFQQITLKDSSPLTDVPKQSFDIDHSSPTQGSVHSQSTRGKGSGLPDLTPRDSLPVVPRKRSLDVQTSPPTVPFALVSKRSHADLTNRLSTKQRISRMKTLQAEIEANKAFQNVKMIAMEEARARGDFSTSSALNEHVKLLKVELKELEGAFSILKQKQNRSRQYFKAKTKANVQDTSSSQGDALSPIEPISFEISSPTSPSASTSATDLGTTTQNDVTGIESQERVSRPSKRKAAPRKLKAKKQATGDGSQSEVKDLVDNVNSASDKLNSIIQGDEMSW